MDTGRRQLGSDTAGTVQSTYIVVAALVGLVGTAGFAGLGRGMHGAIAGNGAASATNAAHGVGSAGEGALGHGADGAAALAAALPSAQAGALSALGHLTEAGEAAVGAARGTVRVPWHEVTEADLAAKELAIVGRKANVAGSGSTATTERWTVRTGDGREFDVAAKFGRGQEPRARREAAFYRLDQLLGGDTVVPPTVARELPEGHGFGSLQVWIDDAAPRWFTSTSEQDEVLAHAGLRRVIQLDQLTAHQDRHAGNLLWTRDGRVFAIDGGYTFERTAMTRNVKTPFQADPRMTWFLYRPTEDFLTRLAAVDARTLGDALHGLGIEGDAIRTVLRRRESLLREPKQFHPHGMRIGSMKADNWDAPLHARNADPNAPLPGLDEAAESSLQLMMLGLPAPEELTRSR